MLMARREICGLDLHKRGAHKRGAESVRARAVRVPHQCHRLKTVETQRALASTMELRLSIQPGASPPKPHMP